MDPECELATRESNQVRQKVLDLSNRFFSVLYDLTNGVYDLPEAKEEIAKLTAKLEAIWTGDD